ncbi:phospho-sugar mutase [Corynebacterium sp. 22KM0430]|uniref:phospho-sugar mutase n=1 Tax=Corynebacterium sp. 22KM0430 TaxID=2989735 RepID=UPI0029CAA85E|nr:phospho-sugar mutase [Corynebacterium sp. 22KM0430]WPF65350.1 phospho-sugar mutase [Corynebacterium sp. 22KM0430]
MTSTLQQEVLDRARRWRDHDPDPHTRAELDALIARRDPELARRFAGPLTFGTAGLRGRLGAGESRMNLATVIRASRGLGRWLSERGEREGWETRPRVVVGCDARHGSREFHRATAEVLAAAGCEVLLLPGELPTPVTAFAVRHLDCEAGVMVTASHNPPQDNGYKVYLGGRAVSADAARGVQLIAPNDSEIAAAIAAAEPADEVPRRGIEEHEGRAGSAGAERSEYPVPVGEEIVEAYVRRVLRGALPGGNPVACDLPIVVTALHGVGGEILVRVLREAGFSAVTPVAEQQRPDPDFPTVDFPNPEEPGALDLAYATAKATGARLILALDPDADRCAVAIPVDVGCGADGSDSPEGADGSGSAAGKAGREQPCWEQLSGDRVGALLGEEAASGAAGEGAAGVLACSIVSSRLLERIAQRHGLGFAPTLTGFKWIGRVPGLVFGYEEAIGYCPDPQAVRDKDGIAACLRVALLAARCAGQGESLREYGQRIDAAYGVYLTRPLTVRMDSPEQAAAAVERFLAAPPDALDGTKVTAVHDLGAGYRGLPATPGVVLFTQADDRVILRPSGTEPKLKCYAEVIAQERSQAQERMAALLGDLEVAVGAIAGVGRG